MKLENFLLKLNIIYGTTKSKSILQGKAIMSLHPTAAILIIGDEVLSGRTQDLNVQFIAKHLTNLGIRLSEVRVIADDEEMIMSAVNALSQSYSVVFTTGGIGATHDDITAASIAKAFKTDLIINEEAMRLLLNYYGDQINDARKRLALIPKGARLIPNPVSAAPGFIINNVYCMAGIPVVMHQMFENIVPLLPTGAKFHSQTIKCSILENNLADDLRDIQKEYLGLSIGSYPRYTPSGDYNLNLVLRGIDKGEIEQATKDIISLIQKHGQDGIIE